MIGAIILAGGRAKRMGGGQKANTVWHGKRFLDLLQDDLDAECGRLELKLQTVVVAPKEVAVNDRAKRTLEDPPFGGPVAGVRAGLAALDNDTDPVLLLSCDAPFAANTLEIFWAAWTVTPETDVITAPWQPHSRPMPALFSRSALQNACADPKVSSLRGLYADRALRWQQISVPQWMLQGANTPQELAKLRAPNQRD